MEDMAIRRFKASGPRVIGPASIGSIAFTFASEEDASAAIPDSIDFAMKIAIEAFGLERPLMQRASAPQIGDERVAYLGELRLADEPDAQTFPIGFFGWSDENRVIVVWAVEVLGDPLEVLFSIGRTIVGREPGPEPVTAVEEGTLRNGGLWDVLPTLDDIPEGFVLLEELTLSELLERMAPAIVARMVEAAATPTP